MALFSRKKKNETLVTQIVAELQKATGNNMGNTPYGGTGYATTSAAMPSQMVQSPGSGGQGLLQTPGTQANPLPRYSYDFGSQLGPSAPFLPAPLDPVFDDSGRALPRLWEYPVAWNLDLNQRTAPWSVLRSMADQIDIIHRCIEIKIAEITRLEWSFSVEDSTINQIMAEQNCSHAKAARIAREKYDEDIVKLREFWENPYPQLGRSFTEWMTEFLWQHFVFDGTPVYPRYNLGKNIIGFEIIDAPTIKVLLDNRGAVPATPAPAYQQILWGFPRGEYQASPESDGEFFNAPGKNNEYMRDQLAYFVRNRRTWSPYGYSCVEESIPSATLYLERQQWMKSEYQDGTMPMAFMETDSDEMDITRLAAFERVFNDRITGSNAERHRMKVLPRGFKPVFAPTIDERYKENYDNFLILRIATIFGVNPSALGIIPRSGLGGAGEREGEAQSALTTSQKPLESFLVETINTLSRRFLDTDKNITFAFDDDDDNVKALETKSKAYQVSLESGQMTMNDVRGELGMPLYDMPEADEPFIVAGNQVQFLNGLLEQNAAGETVGMKENVNVGTQTQSQKPEETQSPQSSQSGDKGKQTEAVVEQKSVHAEEIFEFARFIKSRTKTGKWRAFDFVTVNEELADKLNSDAYFIVKGTSPMPENLVDWALSITKAQISDNPKGLLTKRSISDLPGIEHKLKIEEHYKPQIQKAIADSVSGIDAAIAQALSTEKKVGADVLSKIKFDIRPLKKIITNTLLDGGLVGSAYAVRQLDKYGATGVSQLTNAAIGFDWANWKPGDPIAASLVSDGKLRKTLNGINLTITGIKKTTVDRIGNLIGDGIAQGLPATAIGKTIDAFINDPARAEMIAITETNRAYNEGAVDQYSQFGVSEWEWVAYDDACPDCLDIEANGPYSTNDSQAVPPEHPNCRCTVNAVISTS